MRVTVRVPATAANLGPGFDCLGLALDLCNDVTVDTDAEPGVAWEGEGADELPVDGSDLISRTIASVAAAAGAEPPAYGLLARNRIPLERGLGSSAAAAVAGVLLADRLLDLGLSADDLLSSAVGIEGHPDNAAAALLGGLTVATDEAVARLDPSPELRPVVLVPEARLATVDARAAIPREVALADAVFNVQRTALAVVALTQRPELLRHALDDRLHQGVRLEGLPEVAGELRRLRERGVPACLSGAGPSLLAFETDGLAVGEPARGWRALRPGVRAAGAERSEG